MSFTANPSNIVSTSVRFVPDDGRTIYADNVAALRGLVGESYAATKTVVMLGTATPGDGGVGIFYWNSSSTAPDDNGGTAIRPYGVKVGAWLRAAATSALTQPFINVMDFGAIADGQKVSTNATMAVGSNLLTVSTPTFVASDVGKSIAVFRQDVMSPFSPWYQDVHLGNTAVAKIATVANAQTVTLDHVGTVAPPNQGTEWPVQSWPYSNTPSIIMWGSDNSPAFQAALDHGSTVFIPDGHYCFAKTLVLHSNNTLFGGGPGALLMPLGVINPVFQGPPIAISGQSIIAPLFINDAFLKYWSTYEDPAGNPTLPVPVATLLATIGDQNITIRDFMMDMSAGSGPNGPSGGITSRMFLVTNATVERIKIIGSAVAGYEGPTFIGCNEAAVRFCDYENTWTGFSPWSGCTNVTFAFNQIVCPTNTWPNVSRASGYIGIEINCMGTLTNDSQVVSQLSIIGNTIQMGGSPGSYVDDAPLWLFPDGTGSAFSDIHIAYNKLIFTGTNHGQYGAIMCNGPSLNLDISHNIIDGYNGRGPVIWVRSDNEASGNPTSISSTAGSNIFTVAWPGHSYTGFYLSRFPVYFFNSAASIVGGANVNGYWPLHSVPDANTITITGPTAISTQTVPWTPGFAQILGLSIGAKISDNMITNSTLLATQPLISASPAIGPSIMNNDCANNNTGYQTIVFFAGLNGQRTATIFGNTGETGTGGVGSNTGTGRVAWNPFEPAPLIIDPDDVAGVVNFTPRLNPLPATWQPVLSFGGVTTGITYSSQSGIWSRVGNICHFYGQITLTSKGSAIGQASISGLPFPSDSLAEDLSAALFEANFTGIGASPQGTTTPIVKTVTVGGLIYTLVSVGSGGASGTYALAYSGGTGSGASGTVFVVGPDAVGSATVAAAGSGGVDGSYVIPVVGGGGTGGTVSVVVNGGAIAQASISGFGSGYTSAPTLPLTSIPHLTGGSVTLALGTGAIVSLNPADPGSYTVAPTVSTAAVPGLTGASITATVNTGGTPVQLGIVGSVHGQSISLAIGPPVEGGDALTSGNFSNASVLRMAGWYFIAPGS